MGRIVKPLKGHRYHELTDAALYYVINDAQLAAANMRDFDYAAETKYLDQINDAYTVLHYRTLTRQGRAAKTNP